MQGQGGAALKTETFIWFLGWKERHWGCIHWKANSHPLGSQVFCKGCSGKSQIVKMITDRQSALGCPSSHSLFRIKAPHRSCCASFWKRNAINRIIYFQSEGFYFIFLWFTVRPGHREGQVHSLRCCVPSSSVNCELNYRPDKENLKTHKQPKNLFYVRTWF